jgi:hypothetical protein
MSVTRVAAAPSSAPEMPFSAAPESHPPITTGKLTARRGEGWRAGKDLTAALGHSIGEPAFDQIPPGRAAGGILQGAALLAWVEIGLSFRQAGSFSR